MRRHRRLWLNQANESDDGWMKWSFDEDGNGTELHIFDCTRKVSLAFSWWNEKQAKQRLRKMQIFEEAIAEFCTYAREEIYEKYPKLKP